VTLEKGEPVPVRKVDLRDDRIDVTVFEACQGPLDRLLADNLEPVVYVPECRRRSVPGRPVVVDVENPDAAIHCPR
jgi:hypothetical protein